MRYATRTPPGGLMGSLLVDKGAEATTFVEDWDLALVDRGADPTPWLEQLQPTDRARVVSAVPGWDLLCSKASLWMVLRDTFGRAQAESLVPATWLLHDEHARADLAGRHTEGDLYVLKQPGLQAREGLKIARSLEEALAPSAGLAQRLVPRVATINGHRTQLRLYVVVERHRGRMTAWLHKNGKVLQAPRPWKEAPATPETTFTLSTPETEALPGPRNLTQLMWDLNRLGINPRPIQRRIERTIAAASEAVMGVMATVPAAAGYRYSQLFGVDVLVTFDHEVRLLEFNRGPDMGARSEADARLKLQVLTSHLGLTGALAGEDLKLFKPLADVSLP